MTYTPPTEAVEIAARAMFASEQCDLRQKQDLEANWIGRLSDHDRDEYRRLTTAALSAAASFIQAAALRDAANAVREECSIRSGECFCGSADWLRASAATIEGKSE